MSYPLKNYRVKNQNIIDMGQQITKIDVTYGVFFRWGKSEYDTLLVWLRRVAGYAKIIWGKCVAPSGGETSFFLKHFWKRVEIKN